MPDEELIDDYKHIDDDDVIDEAGKEEFEPLLRYDVTSYGSDPEVEVLFNRIKRGDIVIPEFQRNYVWGYVKLQDSNKQEAADK
jgi:hypothetical protein